jgi:hypothetical protein
MDIVNLIVILGIVFAAYIYGRLQGAAMSYDKGFQDGRDSVSYEDAVGIVATFNQRVYQARQMVTEVRQLASLGGTSNVGL